MCQPRGLHTLKAHTQHTGAHKHTHLPNDTVHICISFEIASVMVDVIKALLRIIH